MFRYVWFLFGLMVLCAPVDAHVVPACIELSMTSDGDVIELDTVCIDFDGQDIVVTTCHWETHVEGWGISYECSEPVPLERGSEQVDLDAVLTPPQWVRGDCLVEPTLPGCEAWDLVFDDVEELEVSEHWTYLRRGTSHWVSDVWFTATRPGEDGLESWVCREIYAGNVGGIIEDWGAGCEVYDLEGYRIGTWSWHSD